MIHPRRFSATRIAAFLLIVTGIVVWDAQKKIPAGPAEGSTLQGPPSATQPAGPTLRVATFNIDGGAEGLDRVAHAMSGFDLVGLQEVHGLEQTAFLAQSLHQSYVYAPVETQWWFKSFGNAAITHVTTLASVAPVRIRHGLDQRILLSSISDVKEEEALAPWDRSNSVAGRD